MPDLCRVITGLRTEGSGLVFSLGRCPSSGIGSSGAVLSSGTVLKCWLFLRSGPDGV